MPTRLEQSDDFPCGYRNLVRDFVRQCFHSNAIFVNVLAAAKVASEKMKVRSEDDMHLYQFDKHSKVATRSHGGFQCQKQTALAKFHYFKSGCTRPHVSITLVLRFFEARLATAMTFES